MISIVTAYYNRRALFIRTLESLVHFGGPEFEVVVVDDGSREEERLEDLVERFPFLRVFRLDPRQKWYSNPCIPFNIAIRQSRGESVILQNPECFHAGPVVKHVAEHLHKGKYLSYACYALSNPDTKALRGDAEEVQAQVRTFEMEHKAPVHVASAGWYNHSQYSPRGYHFCCAISRADLERLGGFDERYSHGIAYDDDDLLHRIRVAGLRIEFVDEPYVYHQNHYLSPGNGVPCEKIKRNEKIFRLLTQPSRCYDPNGADWGHPENPSAREANIALDALVLGVPVREEDLARGNQWKSYAEQLEGVSLASAEGVHILRESLKGPLDLVEYVKGSFISRWGWRSKHERELERIHKSIAKAEVDQDKGKHERAAEGLVKVLRSASALAAKAATRAPWGGTSKRAWSRSVESQMKAIDTWWKRTSEGRKAAKGARPK